MDYGIQFTKNARRDFEFWQRTDERKVKRINKLLRDAAQSPSRGIGKPEPLRHELRGCWSRRIDGEHRLVYLLRDGQLWVLACRYHY